MKLSYIMGMLASGELANLNLAEDHINIKPERQLGVLRAINAGLEDLHTRFLLKRNRVILDVLPGSLEITIEEPDFIEVIEIYHNGALLSDNTYVKKTPNTIWLPYKLGILDTLSVEYKARHKELTELDIDLDSEVDLPMSYLNALLYFVAARFHVASVQPMDNERGEGMTYARKFQEEIMLMSNQGIDADSLLVPDTFRSRGFV